MDTVNSLNPNRYNGEYNEKLICVLASRNKRIFADEVPPQNRALHVSYKRATPLHVLLGVGRPPLVTQLLKNLNEKCMLWILCGKCMLEMRLCWYLLF